MDSPANVTQLLLGIDGGGSKTEAWLARRDATGEVTVIGRAQAGPANPLDLGITAAQSAIRSAVNAAFGDAGLPLTTVSVAVMAVAGAAGDEPRQLLETWAVGARLAERCQVVADAEPVIAAGTPDGWGIALIAGTGSFARGRNQTGKRASAGGYGYLVGDEGSGFWLGKQALAAVVRQLERRGPETRLADALIANADFPDSTALKRAVYAHGATRQSVAALAPLVADAAQKGDSVAAGILAEGARELAALVASVARDLGLAEQSFPLALAGSVLVNCRMMRDQLGEQLAAIDLTAEPSTLVPEPVAGCVRLAEHL